MPFDMTTMWGMKSTFRSKQQVCLHITWAKLAKRELARGATPQRARELISDFDHHVYMAKLCLNEWRELRKVIAE